MDKFIAELCIEPQPGELPPSSLLPRLKCLVTFLLPGLTPEQLGEILALRATTNSKGGNSANMGLIGEKDAMVTMDAVMEASDKKACQDELNELEATKVNDLKLTDFLIAHNIPVPGKLAAAQKRLAKQPLKHGAAEGGRPAAALERPKVLADRQRRRCHIAAAPRPMAGHRRVSRWRSLGVWNGLEATISS